MQNAAEKKSDLKTRWQKLLDKSPHIRIRDAAQMLGTSEAELLATDVGESVIRLNNNFDILIKELKSLGRVMALTRNDAIVHERKGEYFNVEVFDAHGKMGLVLGEDIDLRIFFKNWHFGFAVISQNQHKTQRSFQFFDSDGTAVHKIYLTESSHVKAFENLVEKYRNSTQNRDIEVSAKAEKIIEKNDSEIDVEGFQKAWAAMNDTHDFFGVIKKFGVSRLQALRFAESEMAMKISLDSYQKLLQEVAAEKLPIMIFVNSAGVIQIHTGKIENIKAARGWFNVLDENFNLHIKESEIDSAWIVRKPTKDGIVSSLELFDKHGENVALLFGKRKPGMPEDERWRERLETLRTKIG